LKAGTWGILEPEPDPGRAVRPETVACVLVPGVAFDADGNRIGNGKGFYDRFLKTLKPGAAKIGLAYSLQMVPRVPVDAHDVKLDLVLTD
jgi:5-formyltetrahydrofolate cyclo-ligase